MTRAESMTAPTVQRWQSGYEIPVMITSEQRTDPQSGNACTIYRYHRMIMPALTVQDISMAVDRDFDGDPAILAEALALAQEQTAPDVPAIQHTQEAIVDVLASALGGGIVNTDEKLTRLAEKIAAQKSSRDRAKADLAELHGQNNPNSVPRLAGRVAALEEIIGRLVG